MGNLNESILCIKGDVLFKDGKWNGLKTDNIDSILETISKEGEYRPRHELEEDSSFKQIIAQVILKYKDKYYICRQVKRNEDRLNSTCQLALGGHIQELDQKDKGNLWENGLMRELGEEVKLNANIIKKTFLGLIYIEDENPVNWVHVGIVSVFELDSDDVHAYEEGLEDIGFVSIEYLKTNPEKLNYWSKLLTYHL